MSYQSNKAPDLSKPKSIISIGGKRKAKKRTEPRSYILNGLNFDEIDMTSLEKKKGWLTNKIIEAYLSIHFENANCMLVPSETLGNVLVNGVTNIMINVSKPNCFLLQNLKMILVNK